MRTVSIGRLAFLLVAVGVMNPRTSADPSIEWVTVGNPGNDADTEVMNDGTWGYGSVSHVFRIAKYEVTAEQYCAFLNAVAADDTYSLFDARTILIDYRPIVRSGSDGSYTYSVLPRREAEPAGWLSWYDALRFANWMHNGCPTGAQDAATTEDGAYTFSGPTEVGLRNPGALVFLASEDEWYKAAYYDPDHGGPGVPGYWNYATQSDNCPDRVPPEQDTGNAANYSYATGTVPYCTDVGAYTQSSSAYGTFDQAGNVWEWNESRFGDESAYLRGSSWMQPSFTLPASFRPTSTDTYEAHTVGFRVACSTAYGIIPEPFSMAFMASAFVGVVGWRARSRRRRNA